MLLREGARPVRQFSVPPGHLRTLLAVAVGAVAVVTAAAALLTADTAVRVRAAMLSQENQILEARVAELNSQISGLDRRVAVLTEQSNRARLAAGLTGIDEEVFDVGIGGPGLESPGVGPLWALDPVAAEASYAVRYDVEVLERKARLLDESLNEATLSLESQWERAQATPSILPVGGLISSGFSQNRYHPILHTMRAHEGMDIRAESGRPILAAANGRVSFRGWKEGFGNTVEVQHGFGYRTLYAHASKLLVREGQMVRRGTVIAEVGCTGLCTASHLHYEVHVNGVPVNPKNYILGAAIP